MKPARTACTAMVLVTTTVMLAACGGGGSSTSESGGEITEAQRIAAATATAEQNPRCSTAVLGSYYWEVGDSSGAKASGSRGGGAPTAATTMRIFSASKWLYAASVVQRRGGIDDAEAKFLNFTSGYSQLGNSPVYVCSTVNQCLVGNDSQDAATIDRYAYDSGHMQHHASASMGLGAADTSVLAADLRTTLGDFGLAYRLPVLASGVEGTPAGYAQFLRRLLRNELTLAGLLGSRKVCAQPSAPGCNAAYAPDSIGTEAWNYSLGHWVEDDPSVGDHAFSSAGGAGFYPWIDATRTWYGIVARERTLSASELEPGAGYRSAECGRLIRQAWRTGQTVTSTTPTPP